MKHLRICLLIVGLLGLSLSSMAQTRMAKIRTDVEKMAQVVPGLDERAELSMSGVSIQEFLRALGQTHNLNLTVDPTITAKVSNSFSDARVADVLVFLCKEYNMDMDVEGTIMIFKPHVDKGPPPSLPKARKLDITYSDQTDFLSFKLRKDTLSRVLEEITRISMYNVIPGAGIGNQLVDGYVQNRPFSNALEMLGEINGLKVEEFGDRAYKISLADQPLAQNGRQTGNSTARTNRNTQNTNKSNLGVPGDVLISVTEGNMLAVEARNAPISDVIQAVSAELGKNYFLFSEPEGNTTLVVDNVTYDEFLSYMLNGTNYTFKIEDDVHLIGERSLERLRTTEMVQLQNRTVETVIDFIPSELKEGVEIKEFMELNSLVLAGSHPRIDEIKRFLRDIDQVVPVVLIDVIIVEYDKSNDRTIGTGFGNGADAGTNNNISLNGPGGGNGANVTLNAQGINNLINSFNGFGLVNLGRVGSDFLLSLEALEQHRIIKKRSTPKLSTLNGHEASLSTGSTEYYAEQTQQFIGAGTLNGGVQQAQRFAPVSADFSINIKPMVSGDEQVTLTITVSKSNFGDRVSETAPPSQSTLKFESAIRVRNGETILLGGLEDNVSSQTSSGLPWISRVPVLKWFFGKETKSKSKAKLNIFIKPTILF